MLYQKFLKLGGKAISFYVRKSHYFLIPFLAFYVSGDIFYTKINNDVNQYMLDNKYLTTRTIVAESVKEFTDSVASASHQNYLIFMKICKVYFTTEKFNKSLFAEKNSDLLKELVLLHELSHCESRSVFKNNKDILIHNNLSEDKLTYLGNFLFENRYRNTLSKHYEENFADMYGVLIFLKKHNYSKESFDAVDRLIEIRKGSTEKIQKEVASLTENKDDNSHIKFISGYWSHDTSEGLELLMKDIKKNGYKYYEDMSPNVLKVTIFNQALDETLNKINYDHTALINFLLEMNKNKVPIDEQKKLFNAVIFKTNKRVINAIDVYFEEVENKKQKLALKP